MDTTTREALQDLLNVRTLSEIQPVRVQQWQQAVQSLLGAAEGMGVTPASGNPRARPRVVPALLSTEEVDRA